MLARARNGSDIAKYEAILAQVERKVALGLIEYEKTGGASFDVDELQKLMNETEDSKDDPESSARARRENKRPWWVVQPIIRPLPKEALAKGALQLSKKELKAKAEAEEKAAEKADKAEKAVAPAAVAEEDKSKSGAAGVVAAAAGAAVEAVEAAVEAVAEVLGVHDEAEVEDKGEKKTEGEAPVPVQEEKNGVEKTETETAVESLETTTSYPKSELVSG